MFVIRCVLFSKVNTSSSTSAYLFSPVSMKGESRIEDFALNFFCISSDVANSEMVIHTTGTAWKYVRASMSLAGYLPPIADGQRLLADGGYMNILPADVMAETMGAKTVIAGELV